MLQTMNRPFWQLPDEEEQDGQVIPEMDPTESPLLPRPRTPLMRTDAPPEMVRREPIPDMGDGVQMAIGSAAPPDTVPNMGVQTPRQAMPKMETPQTDKLIADAARVSQEKPKLWQQIGKAVLPGIDWHPNITRHRQDLGIQQMLADEERKAQQAQVNLELKGEQIAMTDAQKQAALAQRDASAKKLPSIEELSAMKFPDGRPVFTPEQITILMGGGKLRQEKNATSKPLVTKPGDVIRDPNNPSNVIATNEQKEPAATGDFQKIFLPAYAQKLNKSVKELTPDETIKAFSAFREANVDTDLRAANLESRAALSSMRQMQMNQQPTAEQAKEVAADLVSHRIAPEQLASLFGGFGTSGQAFKRMVYAEGKKLDPNFNYEQAAAEYGLTKSPAFQNTVRYMDSVRQSIPQVIRAAQVLANGKVRGINAFLNAGKRQFNSIDLGRFNTDRILVADEIAKLLQGGGTGSGTSDAKLRQAGEIIRETDDPALVASNLNEVYQLLGYRRGSLTKGTYFERPEEQHATPVGADNSTIEVIAPDGTHGTIPRVNIQKAIERGYKVAPGQK